MKIDYPELVDRYDDFWEIQQNALEIFGEIEVAFEAYRNMESFKGDSATGAKAYLRDVHSKVIDTFEVLLMDYETRMYLMKTGFSENVDSSAVALLEAEYIDSVLKSIKKFEEDFDYLATEINAALSPIADLIDAPIPLDAQGVYDAYDNVTKNGRTVIDDLEAFDTYHQKDMDAIDGVFANLDKAFSFISGACTSTGLNYTSGQAFATEWSKDLAGYRIDATKYAETNDPNFGQSCYIPMLINSGIPLAEFFGNILGYADDGKTLAINLKEIYEIYKAGLNFAVTEFNGHTYLKLSPANGTVSAAKEMVELAKKLDLNVSTNTAEKLFGEHGLRIMQKGQDAFINPRMWENVADVGDALSDTKRKFSGAQSPLFGVLDFASWGVMLGVNAHDAHYNARSGRYEMPTAESMNDTARNTGIEVGFDIAGTMIGVKLGAKIGGLAGSAAGPVGSAMGIIIGGMIGFALNLKLGEPPKSAIDHTKGFFEDVDTFFDNCALRLVG